MSDPTSSAYSRASLTGLGSLFGALYFIQGIGDPASGLIAQPVRSLLDRWGEGPAAIATLMAVMALPWSLKPLLALLSDFVPLLGSRRRSYLIAATAAAAIGLGVAYYVPLMPGDRWLVILLLFVPTLGIAFTDVLADALMIEVGKPRGLTGRLQSVQWFAAYLALLLSGVVGGWLTATGRHEMAFLICALLWAASLGLTLAFVHEPHHDTSTAEFRHTARALRGAFAEPGLLTICIIAFIWDFNPLSYSVNYLHITDTLGLSEQVFGNASAAFAVGAMVATVAYGSYGYRLSAGVLLNVAVAAGVAGNLLYSRVDGSTSFYVVSTLVGCAYMTGSLILLDLAARLVPVQVAATVFAVIMALANLGASVAEALGGMMFESALARYAPEIAYHIVLLAGASVIASSWLLVPRLRRQLRLQVQPEPVT